MCFDQLYLYRVGRGTRRFVRLEDRAQCNRFDLDTSEQILQRIGNRYHIPPLDLEGTRTYMETRLKAAGVAPIENLNQPFDPSESEALSVQAVPDPDVLVLCL